MSLLWWFLWRVRDQSPFAILSALSFPSMLMCHRTHGTSMFAIVFSSGKVVAVSTDFCNFRWFDPGLSFVVEVTDDVLSAVDTQFGNGAGHETFLDSSADGGLYSM